MAEINVNMVISDIFDSNESNKWKPSDKIPLVTREIESLKTDLRIFLQESDFDISSIAKEGRELLEESKELIKEMEDCRQEMEQKTMADILMTVKNHDCLTKQLDLINFTINIICDIITCGRFVKDFDECKKVQTFSQSVETITDLLQTLENPSEGFSSLSMYENVKSTALVIWENLQLDLKNQWDRMISWSQKAAGDKDIITMDIMFDDSVQTTDVLNALSICQQLPMKVAMFSKFLLNEVLTPMIHHACTLCAETEELLTITIYRKQQDKPPYEMVMANLRHLFNFLSNKLNFDLGKGQTIIMMIGKEISIEFSDVLVRDCLIGTIPNSINELQSYGDITSDIEEFQNFLTVLRFFPDDNFSILQYVNNIDVLFADKCSQYFLEKAREIMLKDLSNTMSIGVETIPNSTAPNADFLDVNDEDALKIFDGTIPQSLFYFPRCMISKSAQELLDLLYMMMEQAVQCSDFVYKRLYMTTKLVFELYDAVVPYHHENFLQTIPQYVGKLR